MTDAVDPATNTEELLGFDQFEITLGDEMRGERATLGKSLHDVADSLKINQKYLEAIENCDLTVFPTPSFISGHVRSYAKYLGMDPQKSFERFCEQSGFDGVRPALSEADAKSKKSKTSALSPRSQALMNDPIFNPRVPNRPAPVGVFEMISVSGIVSTALLCALIAGVGYGGYSVLQEVQRVQFAPINETPGVASDTVNLDLALIDDISTETTSLNVAESSGMTLEDLYRPQELEIPQLVARDGPIVALDPQLVGTMPVAPQQPEIQVAAIEVEQQPTKVKVVEDGPPAVDIVALRPAWVRVFQKSGGILFEKTLDAGERYRVPADVQDALLRAGNSGSVYVMVGDKTYGPVGVKTGVARKVPLGASEVSEKFAEVTDLFDSPLAPPVNTAQLADVAEITTD
ncbi:helix-turn-helix domain-containing protein [Paramylibacter ulvae]|nr:helix-turn-helix domain-containing protein [Amylibacter ulvae]